MTYFAQPGSSWVVTHTGVPVWLPTLCLGNSTGQELQPWGHGAASRGWVCSSINSLKRAGDSRACSGPPLVAPMSLALPSADLQEAHSALITTL